MYDIIYQGAIYNRVKTMEEAELAVAEMAEAWMFRVEIRKCEEEKPQFATRELCAAAIKANPCYVGCSPMFIGDHYAKALGVSRGGWYLYSRNKASWVA